ncbi:MAG: hypothetical protein PHQ13_16035, partial [Rhodoferax sp.]|nr:hypothetical protein [Rhodoferax sp.]
QPVEQRRLDVRLPGALIQLPAQKRRLMSPRANQAAFCIQASKSMPLMCLYQPPHGLEHNEIKPSSPKK